MKKIFLLTLMIFSFSFGVFAEGAVEISFCVGESTLSVNGENITVETPYVVGSGVTLVPVRVITEAFGAKVGWIEESKMVTLDYEDKNIKLQIDNPIAVINGEESTLLSAPELTLNGVTMVPLRFISENFGADVGYDEIAKRITVIKAASKKVAIWEISGDKCINSAFGFEITVPQSFEISAQSKNEALLKSSTEGDRSFLSMGFFSKSEGVTATTFARRIMEENKNRYNKEVVLSDTDIAAASYSGFSGCEIRVKIASTDLKAFYRSVFFEVGDYIYSVSVLCDEAFGGNEGVIDSILNSVSVSGADASSVGKLESETATPDEEKTVSILRGSFVLPGNFRESEESTLNYKFQNQVDDDEKSVYEDGEIIIEVRRIEFEKNKDISNAYKPEGELSFDDVKRLFAYDSKFLPGGMTTVENSGKKIELNGKDFMKAMLKAETGSFVKYYDVYAAEHFDSLYIFTAVYPEIYYANDNRIKVQNIMSTVNFEGAEKVRK